MTEATNQENQAAAAPAAPAPKDERNGVTRPKDATGATGKVWDIADKLSAELKRPATRGEVLEAGKKAGVNPATITTQYGRWCKYYGLKNTSAHVLQAKKDERAKAAAEKKAKADQAKAEKDKAEADKKAKAKADKEAKAAEAKAEKERKAAEKKANADAAAAAKAQVTPPPAPPAAAAA